MGSYPAKMLVALVMFLILETGGPIQENRTAACDFAPVGEETSIVNLMHRVYPYVN